MSKKPLSISLVIPAYNEESHLAACLGTALAQAVPFAEIIVVDNNSSDDTAAIAARFPGVIVRRENRQGVVFARNKGFDSARSDIIARIDADTRLPADWTLQLGRLFADESLDGVSGSIGFTDVPFETAFARIDLFFRRFIAHQLQLRDEQFLFGGNMALRQRTWRLVRKQLCEHNQFHEDMDLAAHLVDHDANIRFSEQLRASVSARRLDSSFRVYRTYVLANSRTYAAHGLAGRRYMYLPELLAVGFYVPLRLLYRSYDSQTERMSLRRAWRPDRVERISPVAEVV